MSTTLVTGDETGVLVGIGMVGVGKIVIVGVIVGIKVGVGEGSTVGVTVGIGV
jgi:hypothetical protein